MVGIIVDDMITGLAVEVIKAFGHKLAEPLRTLNDAKVREDLELATWFDTYQATDSDKVDPPAPPTGFSEDELRELLDSNELHAILHELLAARITKAPEQDVAKLRSALQTFGTRFPKAWPADYLANL